ncbi:mediator of RNA polymerase II transcription subunit 4-like [Selaginella moellendorffii]|uniref:mediator of RNA polymerase II transcription subunit 4-like n=1 Tax=Selaginella moellendorffii TaxID=88036 RepID=UPI000D1C9F01|nr:mediator of RNA polymerase II transcription subunit 4-like [Selaginella moellendorffii]XP_024541121.1 mediator of RNA polymerase II transcription subunit 4-like [Selaginella moellendorffii]|eukprot:XP_024541120.1 mediator of RNA polymerase II transcription subunit 4-like [Selaginella moellendorffii]
MAEGGAVQSLPPHRRAQVLLQDMAGLTVRLLELAGSKSWQGSHLKSLFPPFLAGAPVPAEGLVANSTKDVLALLDSHQSLLSDAVSEIAELQSLEQEKQRIAEAVAAKDAVIREFAKRVRDAEQVLELTLEEFEEYRRPSKERKTMDAEVDVSELVSYAHRISYTTFAPPDYLLGQPGVLAPAPQEQQMRASQLYHFSDMDLGVLKAPATAPPPAPSLPSPTVEKSPPKEAAAGKLTPSTSTPVTLPGLPPGIKLPPMPPGWKPGDPVPLPEVAPPAPGPAAPAPGVIQVPFVQLDLNPELEDDYASDYSNEEQSSEEE